MKFLKKFVGEPLKYYDEYDWRHIVRCWSTHYLFSAYMGLLGFLLIQTILFRDVLKCPDHCIYLVSFLFGLCFCVSVHIVLDYHRVA